MSEKKPILSVTCADLDVQYFCTGGPGGQKQNKTASGCRIVHRASGATGESRELRSQVQNRKRAFERMAESKTFKVWLKMQVAARLQGWRDAEQKIDRELDGPAVKVEFLTEDGWEEQKK